MMRTQLERAVAAGCLRSIDLYAGLFAEKLCGGSCPGLLLAATLASRAVGEGHICLPLDGVAGRVVFEEEPSCIAPDLDEWRKQLLVSGAVAESWQTAPLVLDPENRLYLARYYFFENRIAEDLLLRCSDMLGVDEKRTASLLDRLFPGQDRLDWQKVAAAASVVKKFVVISGGPGTGKTFTVARVLALLQALANGRLRIGLAAPTGRAAVRLHESITRARKTLDPDLAALVPDETQTLHRLLGMKPNSGRFRHNRENPLHLDLLVIDESSMIDVPLMAALVDAVPAAARLIMLGDRDQLTSVEAGSLFGDICGAREYGWSRLFRHQVERLAGRVPESAGDRRPIADSLVQLRASYRFGEKSGIGQLAAIINSGDRERLAGVLRKKHDDLVYEEPGPEGLAAWLASRIRLGFQNTFAARGPAEAMTVMSRFRILCAVREGPAGVTGVNQLAEAVLRQHGYIRGNDVWYRGRPVMIRRNHYGLQLFNGDTGIIWPDGEGQVWAWFYRPDGSLCPVAPSRLPEHETAYATTVHKAQGSEFDEILFILPPEDNRILTRELVYTAITRARRKLILCGDFGLLAESIARRVVRYSGLTDRLWHDK